MSFQANGVGYATREPTLADIMHARALLRGSVPSRFLESLDSSVQDRIFELSAGAARSLHRWAQRYPVIRQVRIIPLCLSVTAAAPFMSVDALVTTARVSLWVFTLDDLFDEGGLPDAELVQLAGHYREIALGQTQRHFDDSLASALLEVREDLARLPLFDTLGRDWAEALCGTINGMVCENRWKLGYERDGVAALPSYEKYVANGLYSIGGPPHVWAALIATGDDSASQHLQHLRLMEHLASTCVRLANDLQSCEREAGEHNVNSLVILSHLFRKDGFSLEEAGKRARAHVLGDIAEGITILGDLQKRAKTRTGRPEAVTADIARFVCEFYSQYDYHTFAGKGEPTNAS